MLWRVNTVNCVNSESPVVRWALPRGGLSVTRPMEKRLNKWKFNSFQMMCEPHTYSVQDCLFMATKSIASAG